MSPKPPTPEAPPKPAPLARLWRWDEPLEPLREILNRGGILAVPTESSYALAVDPCNPRAVEAVYRIKGRPQTRAMPVAVSGRHQLEGLGIDLSALPFGEIEALWPAALSVVLPLRPGCSLPAAAKSASGAAESLAVRVPDHQGLVRLVEALGALTVTSANRSGEPPLLEPAAVARLLAGADAAVVDDGELPGGAPSTLVDWRGGAWRVLRQGRFDPAALPRCST